MILLKNIEFLEMLKYIEVFYHLSVFLKKKNAKNTNIGMFL